MITNKEREQWDEFHSVPSPFKMKRRKNPFIKIEGKFYYQGEIMIKNNDFAFQDSKFYREVLYKDKIYSPEEFNKLHLEMKRKGK